MSILSKVKEIKQDLIAGLEGGTCQHCGCCPECTGKDVKCFEDLPLDIQQIIDRISVVDGKINKALKAKRTAIAIHHQSMARILWRYLFPEATWKA